MPGFYRFAKGNLQGVNFRFFRNRQNIIAYFFSVPLFARYFLVFHGFARPLLGFLKITCRLPGIGT